MKKTYLLLPACALLLTAGCTKDADFLTEDPKTIYTKENAFEKSSQVDDQLTTAYNAAYKLHGFGNILANTFEPLYGYELSETYGGTAASTLGGYGSDMLDDGTQRFGGSGYFSNYATLNAGSGRFNSLWNALYRLISYGNLALYGSGQTEWSNEADKAYADAQAKFFIGWAYLRLAECYGGVPIVKEFTEKLRYDYVRDSRESVYRYAIENLEAALAVLPDYPAEDGRIAKGAAGHYLAEAWLALGTETGDRACFTNAVSAADDVIALHPLMTARFGSRANAADTGSSNGIPNYKADGNVFFDLFQIGNFDRSAGNTEALWTLETPTYSEFMAYDGASYGSNNYYFGTMLGQAYRDLLWNEANTTATSSGPWNANCDLSKYPYASVDSYLGGASWGVICSNDYIDEYIWEGVYADDMRNAQVNICDPVCLDTTHPLYGQVVTKDMLLTPERHARIWAKVKMQDAWGWENIQDGPYGVEWGKDWYAARSAETVLIKAEAQLRGGDAAAAANTANMLRNRAQCAYKLSSADMSLAAILDERARELSWEEHRWPTLLRMGSSLNGGSNEVMKSQLREHAYYCADLGNAPADIRWTLFPIPATVIQLNTDALIEQNPGW